MKRFDVAALGELLIDFTDNGSSAQGNPVLEANPGGAPCNVLAMLNRLGKKTAFIGKVGDDRFGHMLKEVVEKSGTDVTNLIIDSSAHTTLAFVHTMEGGEREFSFYRDPGADMLLTADEVKEDIIAGSRLFHFGTLSSTHEGVRAATRRAIDIAEKSGLLISFDPNLREPLWRSLDDARREIEYGLAHCDILKISDNELEFMTGTDDYDKGIGMLRERFDIELVFLTLGSSGSRAFYKNISVSAPSFNEITPIEKTGAGDTFAGCALSKTLDMGIENITEEKLRELLIFANAGATLVTARKGALKVMPQEDEINELIKRYSNE